jgi:circadian clock protein KaiC
MDEVLGGGIQRGSLAIIAGPPGGGKTILAHQIAFTAARAGRRTTILTAFSEPTNKLIAHMRPFTFFDQDLLGESLDVLSMRQFLRNGLDDSVGEMVEAIRAARANLVVLDGFRGVRESAERPEDVRRFIYDASNRLSLLGITLLLTSEANVRDVTFFPEATTADVLLGLAFDAIDARERRTLEVLKVRGAAPLPGSHALTISDDGVTIHPRLEARIVRRVEANRASGFQRVPVSSQRAQDTEEDAGALVTTGVPGLDAAFGGGLARATSTLVVGERGVGKTLLGLQFALEGVRRDEPVFFVSFRETAEQLQRKLTPFHWASQFQGALDAGMLRILRTPPVELHADVLADTLLAQLDTTGARRLVVDEIGEIERALVALDYRRRFHDFAAALVEALRLRGVTSVLTRQLSAGRRSVVESGLDPLTILADNLLWLREWPDDGRIARSLEVLQTADSARMAMWHPVSIQAPEGITVGTDENHKEATGHSEPGARGATRQSRDRSGGRRESDN